MNTQRPGLLIHKGSGLYYVKWGGLFRYLGRDPVEARRQYGEQLKQWAAWRADRSAGVAFGPAPRETRLIEVYRRFIAAKQIETTGYNVSFLRGSLRRFLNVYATLPAAGLKARDVLAFREDLIRLGLAAKSVNHEIGCVKQLTRWAAAVDLAPSLNLDAVKALKVPAPRAKGYTLEQVRGFLRKAADPNLRAWIALQWCTAARPFEMPRIVAGAGEWIERGVFRLDAAKTAGRVVLFSERALFFLEQCRPTWADGAGYRRAFAREVGPGGPHPLRHGAAAHLAAAGVSRADVDLILGHRLPGRVSQTYQAIQWGELRAKAARLTV